MVVVEVRQGTLRMDGSDWGPAPNNVDRRSQLDEEEEDEEEKEKEEEKQEDEEEERKATDIKSNNPHLAGGESSLTKERTQFPAGQQLWPFTSYKMLNVNFAFSWPRNSRNL